jgi:hypothetical protein
VPQYTWPDMAAPARIMDALRGGPHGSDPERAVVAEVERRWPGSGAQIRAACDFHVRAAEWAVNGATRDEDAWPAAKSVIFAACGYPPSGWDGAALPHSAAVLAVPSARYLYASADQAITMLWQQVLAPSGLRPLASACLAPVADPGQLAGMARIAGLEPPWSVQVQLVAHLWPGPVAGEVVAGWAAVLPPGSSLVLSVPVPGGVGAGGEFGRLIGSVAGTMPHPHSEGAITGWITGAGLELHPDGVEDVRALPGRQWAGGVLGAHLAGHVVGTVGLKPLA